MKTRLIRIGNSVALILDRPLLEKLGLKEDAEVELSTNGDMLVVTPIRKPARRRKLNKILDKMDQQYSGVFRRLAE